MTGTLYIVATPIGNLEDVTLRALRILKEVDLILCEDTRTTRVLLERYEIPTPTESYHAHSSSAKHERIIELLQEGKDLALVSDAGTPTISDPGVLLVDQVRKELGEEARVLAVPGPSALTAALSVSGLSASEFLFLGFLPHKKGRETLFKEIAASKRTAVFYESTHRIMKALDSLAEHAGPEREIVVARELTKLYEESVRGSVAEVKRYLTENAEKQRGEFVVIVAGSSH